MSEWILSRICKPPTCHDVLAYIVNYHDNDLKNIWDDGIYSAFYDEEQKKWFYDEINSDNWKEVEFSNIKVLAWTLHPSFPNIKILEEKWGFADE